MGHSIPTEYTLQENFMSVKLEVVDHEKDLGIYVTNDMKVARQCKQAAQKAINVLRTIKRHFPKINEPVFLILYKSYVRPHLEYCIQAWSPHFKRILIVWSRYKEEQQNWLMGSETYVMKIV